MNHDEKKEDLFWTLAAKKAEDTITKEELELMEEIGRVMPALFLAEKALSTINVRLGADKEKEVAVRDKVWTKIISRISINNNSKRLLRRVTGVAASVAILLTMAGGTIFVLRDSPKMTTIANEGSGAMELMLEDNTHVWLHSGAEINYPEKFSRKQRLVELSGEAFFDVAHDAGRPFSVKTEDVVVEVLGTKFNIKAEKDGDSTEIVLESGSIALSQPKNQFTPVIIKPGELAVVSHAGASVTVSETDPYMYSIWKESELIFRSQPLNKIMIMLGKAYGVEIKLENGTLDKMIYTGKFRKAMPINEVLSIIQMNTPIKYKIHPDGSIVVI